MNRPRASSGTAVTVGVLGAGSIGCWVGGRLAAGGADVVLIGRPRLLDAVGRHGLTVGDADADHAHVPADRLTLTTDPTALTTADVVLVTVKSRDTAAAAASVAAHLPPSTPVVSLQNGLDNPGRLRAALPNPVLAGMVPFNVVHTAPATFTRTTSGEVVVEDAPGADPLIRAAAAHADRGTRAHLPLTTSPDMDAVLRGKLLLNLNNAVNALSGMPLRAQLLDRDHRRVLAACQAEALAVFAAEGVAPVRPTPLPPRLVVRMLRAPTPVFSAVARASLRVHPAARSSMADDLDLGRPTEVDDLQGAVVARGARLGVATPVSAALVRLVHEAETSGADRRRWTGPALRAAVRPGADSDGNVAGQLR